jgi:hypothetical protein
MIKHSIQTRLRHMLTICILILSANMARNQETDKIKSAIFKEIDNAMEKCRQEEVPVFAPTLFEEAVDEYNAAQESYQNKETIQEIQEQIQDSMDLLSKASKAGKISKAALGEYNEARKQAALEDHIQLAPSLYASAERKFNNAILKAESGQIKESLRQAENAMADYRRMTVSALEKGVVRETEAELKRSASRLGREAYVEKLQALNDLKQSLRRTGNTEFGIAAFISEIRGKASEIQSAGTAAPKDMKELPLEEVIKHNLSITRYHIRIEQTPPGLIQEGEVDEAGKVLSLVITMKGKNAPPARFCQKDTLAYGKHSILNRWFRIGVPGQFLAHLRAATELLKEGRIKSVGGESGSWRLDLDLPRLPIQENPEAFLRGAATSPRSRDDENFIQRMIAESRELKISSSIVVSRENLDITEWLYSIKGPSTNMEVNFTFSQVRGGVAPVPAEAEKAPAAKIPLMMLFFHIPSIQGWCETTHRQMAEASIDLIRTKDTGLKYQEVYNPRLGRLNSSTEPPTQENQPILIGAHYEDCKDSLPDFYHEYFSLRPGYHYLYNYYRDYHHFGGESSGLRYEPFFEWRGTSPPTVGGVSYYSARDWGYGGGRTDPALNRLTFTEAIAQYNRYTSIGKRNAYLILGHVLHLFQDQAMPDHAELIAHPGSSYSESGAYSEFYLCEIIAASIALRYNAVCNSISIPCLVLYPVCFGLCIAPIFGAAEADCYATRYDEHDVGYEKLVLDEWTPGRIETLINETGVVKPSGFRYDDFFREIADFSKDEVRRIGLREDSRPIGMDGVFVAMDEVSWLEYFGLHEFPHGMMYVDPDIDSDNPAAKRPFLDLTDSVGKKAISLGAGLIEHFMDIVNPPPYLERVDMTQQGELRYYVEWENVEDGSGTVLRRERHESTHLILQQGLPATIRLQFGPADSDGKHRKMRRVSGSIDGESLTFYKQYSRGDTVYEATFTPRCTVSGSRGPVEMTFRLEGDDAAPHLYNYGRGPGHELDKAPETVAKVNDEPPYLWSDYEYGREIPLEFRFQTGIREAFLVTDRVGGGCTDIDLAATTWTVVEGREATANLILTHDAITRPHLPHDECGRYRIFQDAMEEVEARSGSVLRSGVPEDFGIHVSMDDIDSATPTLRILADPDARRNSRNRYIVRYHVKYESRDGSLTAELSRFQQQLNIISSALCTSMERARATGRTIATAREIAMLDRMGLIDLSEGPPRAFDPCAVCPALCGRPPVEMKRIVIAAKPKVVHVSPKGATEIVDLASLGFTFEQDAKEPASLNFQQGSGTDPGTYLIFFTSMLDGQPLIDSGFSILVNVEK